MRAVLLALDGSLLLMRLREPVSGVKLWLVPGGGIEPDETVEACLRREVLEETGLKLTEVGPLVWLRDHTFRWNGALIRQREQFHLVRVPRFEPTPSRMRDDAERATFLEFRWWSVEQIAASDEMFVPRRLSDHLRALVREGPPEVAIDVGV